MSLYIPNVKLPKDGECVVVFSGGVVQKYKAGGIAFFEYQDRTEETVAVQLPPHGRLIDADKLAQHVKEQVEIVRQWGIEEMTAIAEKLEEGILAEIDLAPTIIEAEGE